MRIPATATIHLVAQKGGSARPTSGGVRRPGWARNGGGRGGPGHRQGGQAPNEPPQNLIPVPDKTRELWLNAERRRLPVHPALAITKFARWKKWGEKPEVDRKGSVGRRPRGGADRDSRDKPEVDRKSSFAAVVNALRRCQPLAEAWRQRRASWLESLGERARIVVVETSSPCVLWLAAPSPLELGFCLHHTYGLPYLPGSGLKGLARRAMCLEKGCPTEEPTPEVLSLFGEGGDKGRAGAVDFLDGIPLHADVLEPDVMTRHHAEYYKDSSGKPPHDCEDPGPIEFLRIRPGARFEIAIIFRGRTETNSGSPEESPSQVEKLLEEAKRYLLRGLEELGLGAKTSSGYGLFSRASAEDVPTSRTTRPAGDTKRTSTPSAETKSGQPRTTPVAASHAAATPGSKTVEKFQAEIHDIDEGKDQLTLRLPDGTLRQVSLREVTQRSGRRPFQLKQDMQAKRRFEVELKEGRVTAFLPKR